MIEEQNILPEGVTLNDTPHIDMGLDIEYENIDSLKCKKCIISFESVLVINYGRHEGYIVIQPAGTLQWKNALSKNREKAITTLAGTLKAKVDTHEERCKND